MVFFKRHKKGSSVKGFEVGRGTEVITQLQFADDTILSSWSRRDEDLVLKGILRYFELASGLKINLGKSMLVEVGWSEGEIHRLASTLHCKVGKLPIVVLRPSYWC